MDNAIGCDVGGSFVKMGLFTREGQLISKDTTPLPKLEAPGALASWLSATLLDFYDKNHPQEGRLVGAGIGVPGPVTYPEGIIFDPPNLPFKGKIPFRSFMEKHFTAPVFVDNDATVQTLGEARAGLGKGTKNFVYIALGTGIGGGIVTEGEIYRGTLGMAGEVGHLTIDYHGRQCLCGSRGCMETYASLNGIANSLKEFPTPLPAKIQDSLNKGQWSRLPAILKKKIERGETRWQEVWDIFADALGAGMGTLINLFNPEKIVISGGLSYYSSLFLPRAIEKSKQYSFTLPAQSCEIAVSELKENTGIIGAAFMAFEQQKL
jgi:glucokinase